MLLSAVVVTEQDMVMLPGCYVSNWTSTDVDDRRRDTGATICEVERWNQEETEDVTCENRLSVNQLRGGSPT